MAVALLVRMMALPSPPHSTFPSSVYIRPAGWQEEKRTAMTKANSSLMAIMGRTI
jgi:hypothetical protein